MQAKIYVKEQVQNNNPHLVLKYVDSDNKSQMNADLPMKTEIALSPYSQHGLSPLQTIYRPNQQGEIRRVDGDKKNQYAMINMLIAQEFERLKEDTIYGAQSQ